MGGGSEMKRILISAIVGIALTLIVWGSMKIRYTMWDIRADLAVDRHVEQMHKEARE